MKLFLNWSQWLAAQAAAAGEDLLFVNLDETAVAQLVPHRRGCVMPAASGVRPALVERIKRSESHGHLTLMAAITSDGDLQAYLPQWVLPKDGGLSRAERARMGRLAPPIVFVPGTSGWVSVESLCPLLTQLRRVVRAHRPGHRLVVAWDAASQHLNILFRFDYNTGFRFQFPVCIAAHKSLTGIVAARTIIPFDNLAKRHFIRRELSFINDVVCHPKVSTLFGYFAKK